MGIRRHLRQIGQISDLDSRRSRYEQLTDAWFADASQFDQPLLLAVDSYENAPTQFDQWFRQEFLHGVAQTKQMRVLIGGQAVPQMEAGWSFCASLQQLEGIHEAKEWLAWTEQVGYQAPSLEAMVWVVKSLNGNPSRIIEVIKTQFPRRHEAIQPKESVYAQRKRFRENMIAAFSLEELKDICSDMEIEYENFANHGQLNSFVRELIAFAGRVGRLNELIDILQMERPSWEW